MQQRPSRLLAGIGFIAVLIHVTATMTEASMDDAVVNFALAKEEMSKLLEAAAQEKPRIYIEQTDKFKKYGELVQYNVEQAGKNLHEKERKWIGETTREKALAQYMKTVAAIASVRQALTEGKSPSSEVSTLKSEWSEFSDAFDKLWDDYQKRGKQLSEAQKEVEERVKLFKDDCKRCF